MSRKRKLSAAEKQAKQAGKKKFKWFMMNGNHPSQASASSEFAAKDSGKFQQLTRICEPISQRQGKSLVFTQFQSICEPLADFLESVFGHSGLVLHGKTPVKRRKKLVQQFQEDESIPFFVVSLKAGGTV